MKAEFEDFSTGGSATAAPTDFSGKKIPSIPNYIFNTGVGYLSPIGVGSRVTVRGAGKRYLDNGNAVSYPGFTIADAEVYYRTNGYTFGVKANNLFNRHYAEYVTLSGDLKRYAVADAFNVMASVRAEF